MARFRLDHDDPPEVELQAAVVKALRILLLPPAFLFAMPVGHVQLTKAQTARLSRIGLRRGLPDLMVVHGGHIHGIELKREGGCLSKTRIVRTARGTLRELEGQQEVFPQLEAAGMPIAVCRSPEQVFAALRGWGVPLRIREMAA